MDSANIQAQLSASKDTWTSATLHTVRDTTFAAALFSIGIPLHKLRSGEVVQGANGRRATWFFDASDVSGQIKTKDVLRAQLDPRKFMAENPQHPLSFALAAIENYVKFHRMVQGAQAKMVFDTGDQRTFFCVENAPPHLEAVRRGMKLKTLPRPTLVDDILFPVALTVPPLTPLTP